jgi:hypothetical protein
MSVTANNAATTRTNLVEFYTNYLGGVSHDLDQVRSLAPSIADNITADVHHPYYPLFTLAASINDQLNACADQEFILRGDSYYRNLLGLPNEDCKYIETKITLANIQDYLEASFNFLCLLNHYETNTNWDTPFNNNDMFVLYRMLLVKQLANLTNPNNVRVENLIKEKIKNFVRDKLNYNFDLVCNDIFHQELLIVPDTSKQEINDPLGNPHKISDLSYIADALRVDLSCVLSSLPPKKLIIFAAKKFLKQDEESLIFAYNSCGKFIPEYSDNFYNKITQTINTTRAFCTSLQENSLLEKTGITKSYLTVVATEVKLIIDKIEKKKTISSAIPAKQAPQLAEALATLTLFATHAEDQASAWQQSVFIV